MKKTYYYLMFNELSTRNVIFKLTTYSFVYPKIMVYSELDCSKSTQVTLVNPEMTLNLSELSIEF
ncbi:hypothetical protein GCM10007028_17510 [Algibacter mikhailovii]|uniref:Uncharacterized protein n=1 Tax=Algibacter mikhailovii TaxID=425498 RepID=A0A918R2U2_9FLAO|nr:hypothetical protein GCM10007028_17510 [Algibacter mikhailovii]